MKTRITKNKTVETVRDLCDECKIQGYCQWEETEEQLYNKIKKLPKRFTFKDYTRLVPLRVTNPQFGDYTKRYLQTAFDAFHQEDYETALINFKVALQARGDIATAYYAIALCYFKLEDYELASLNMSYYLATFYRNDPESKENYFLLLCQFALEETKNIKLKEEHHKSEIIDLKKSKLLVAEWL